ncbi:MAG: polyhydroxyalkanoate synthesis regulator DNA-binding domain-containing protein [Smithellaceae bacterium]|nr:polyhydroxyalkanoate synthesis regulator DNA-binding domain-containing protein [Syntrophaceae bacterium]MDD4242123.1 polyhydroxyalkanoate synthesis regulator DNA-binding domain-containing protein [Smithellaceae bacterium]NLX52900.1 transcriptional regulator [Deltaproteobacteria bacterium]
MAENTLLLKKYTNRRLYDTEKSVYVTLDYVTETIRRGRPIEVRDAKTGEDVTSAILTQIVLEEARKKKYLLPPPLLYLIIRYGENVLTDFFEKYLEQTIRNYLLLRNMADDQFKKWLEYGENASRTNSPPLGGLASFQSLFDLFSAASPGRQGEGKKEKKE